MIDTGSHNATTVESELIEGVINVSSEEGIGSCFFYHTA
jgi:hypothetical protein